MKRSQILAVAIATAFAAGATGAMAAGEKAQGASGGATASPNAPIIVLVPVQLASRDTFSNGCWARLYDSTDFQGNQLSLVGPVDMPNMRTAFGTDWSGQFDSIQVGPKARLTVYDNENYGEKAATFKPSQKVADLDEKMGTFENISSVKVACTGAAPTARSGQGSGASSGSASSGASSSASGSTTGAAGEKESFSKLDTDGDGFIGHIEAAADADAKSKFHRLDHNKDQKLSRSEYEAWRKAGASVGASAKSGEAMTIRLRPQNKSGESGTATLTPQGERTQVVLKLSGAPSGTAQPAHIHDGTCAKLDPKPKHGLESVQNGTSTTVVNASLQQLLSGKNAINVHKSGDEIKTYVACGNLAKGKS